jgi:hypothetical protein
MKRWEMIVDLHGNVKQPSKYLEEKLPNCNVVVYFEVKTIQGMDAHIEALQNPPEKSACELCGKEYETYPIILDCNPISIASLLEDETKPDGSYRHICEKCRDKEAKAREQKKPKRKRK